MWLFSATISGSRAIFPLLSGRCAFLFRLGVFAVLLLLPPVLGCFCFAGWAFLERCTLIRVLTWCTVVVTCIKPYGYSRWPVVPYGTAVP